jgi:hypothetical protein
MRTRMQHQLAALTQRSAPSRLRKLWWVSRA